MDKNWFKPREESKLGLDAGKAAADKKSDKEFYSWIKGEGEDGMALSKLALWLLDELKESHDPKIIQGLLEDWNKNCTKDEFQSRLGALDRLMPAAHPYHKAKGDFLVN